MNETTIKALCMAMFMLLLIITGWQMAETKKANDRLKRMEIAVAVCGDVAAYFAPDDELTVGVELTTPVRKVAQR